MRHTRRTVCAIGLAAAFGALRANASLEDPSLSEYYHLGDYYVRTGQYDKAITNYTAMIAKHPDTKEAERGWLYMGEGYGAQMRQAVADLARATAAGAPKSEIDDIRARIDSRMNQSVAAYRKAVAQFPAARAEAHIGLGLLYAARGAEMMDEARAELGMVVDHFPEEAGRAQLVLGDIALAAGDSAGARQAYDEAQALFPEVASLAMLKSASVAFDEGAFTEAAGLFSSIIDCSGIDGAYSTEYRPIGTVMRDAVGKRADAERALASGDQELKELSVVADRYYGTNVGLAATLKKAEALAHYGKIDEALPLLNDVAAKYPKSVWAVHALSCLARIQGPAQKAVDTWGRELSTWPQSIWWVEGKMGLAETLLGMAAAEKEEGRRIELRTKAANACREIIAASPSCPEGARARAFLTARGL